MLNENLVKSCGKGGLYLQSLENDTFILHMSMTAFLP